MIPGLSAISVPVVSGTRGLVAAVAVVFVGNDVDETGIANRLHQSSRAIAAELP